MLAPPSLFPGTDPLAAAIAAGTGQDWQARRERDDWHRDIRLRFGDEALHWLRELEKWLATPEPRDDWMAWRIYDHAGMWWREVDETTRWLIRQAAEPWQRKADARAADRRAGLIPPEDGTWCGHLMWLAGVFGDGPFTAALVRRLALDGGKFIAPPPYEIRATALYDACTEDFDPDGKRFTLRLGQAYARIAGEQVDGWLTLWQERGPKTDNKTRWWVEADRG